MSDCEYCGQPHARDALCQPRLAVSRRTFLFLGLGAGMTALLPGPAVNPSNWIHGDSARWLYRFDPDCPADTAYLKEGIEPVIVMAPRPPADARWIVDKIQGQVVISEHGWPVLRTTA